MFLEQKFVTDLTELKLAELHFFQEALGKTLLASPFQLLEAIQILGLCPVPSSKPAA
jgi:hypothetical protein